METQKEFSPRAIVLGVFLALVLGAANAYLAAFASMTISASIPAAVMSMLLFRALRANASILENNMAQTIASSGEAVAAGLVFTIPALLITKSWGVVEYWPTAFICLLGGLLGILFMIPLRRTIVTGMPELTFPEGDACAKILEVGQEKSGNRGAFILKAMGVGALFKAAVSILGIVKGEIGRGFKVGNGVGGIGMEMSVELLAVGVYVGINTALVMFLGGLVVFLIGIPVWSNYTDWSVILAGVRQEGGTLFDATGAIWSSHGRYMGVGAMAVAGAYSIWSLRKPVWETVQKVLLRSTDARTAGSVTERTDQDLPMTVLRWLTGLTIGGVLVFYLVMTGHPVLALVVGTIMVVLGFFFTAVASYIVGLVGSSSSPVSGMTLCTLLVTALLVMLFDLPAAQGVMATLIVAGIVCNAASTAGDISQDLRTGWRVGATPRAQQWGEIIAVGVSMLFIPLVLRLLDSAYGLGRVVREGVTPLKCSQSQLFAKVTEALFGIKGEIDMPMVQAGAAIGIIVVVINTILKSRGSKVHANPMAFAVGMYLPWAMSTPILVGALVGAFARRGFGFLADEREKAEDRGSLTAAGLIVGGSLTGVAIGVPIIMGQALPLKIAALAFLKTDTVALLAVGLLAFYIVRQIRKREE